jgi:DNA-binding LytR/AlgR family response regulator
MMIAIAVSLQYNGPMAWPTAAQGGNSTMKLAICDDDQTDLLHLRDLIRQYDAALDVALFSSADALLRAFQAEFYDLIFLDIEMEAPNGYDAAVRLMQQEDKPLIVFVTNSGEYTLRGYGIAFRYLPKPVTYEVIAPILTIALAQLTPKKIAIPANGTTQILSYRQIQYIEVKNHNIHLHTSSNNYCFRGNLRDLEAQFPEGWFAKPHKSFIVNLAVVDHVDAKDVILTNGTAIPLSQRNRKLFESVLLQFIRRS